MTIAGSSVRLGKLGRSCADPAGWEPARWVRAAVRLAGLRLVTLGSSFPGMKRERKGTAPGHREPARTVAREIRAKRLVMGALRLMQSQISCHQGWTSKWLRRFSISNSFLLTNRTPMFVRGMRCAKADAATRCP